MPRGTGKAFAFWNDQDTLLVLRLLLWWPISEAGGSGSRTHVYDCTAGTGGKTVHSMVVADGTRPKEAAGLLRA